MLPQELADYVCQLAALQAGSAPGWRGPSGEHATLLCQQLRPGGAWPQTWGCLIGLHACSMHSHGLYYTAARLNALLEQLSAYRFTQRYAGVLARLALQLQPVAGALHLRSPWGPSTACAGHLANLFLCGNVA